MFNSTEVVIDAFVERLLGAYRRNYGSLEEDDINRQDREAEGQRCVSTSSRASTASCSPTQRRTHHAIRGPDGVAKRSHER